jgi:hypothetical protein
MKKTPRFLLCRNPMLEEEHVFILCTRPEKILFELLSDTSGSFDLSIRAIYSGSESDAMKALEHAKKWYIALLISGKLK